MSANNTAAISPLMKQLAGYIAVARRKALPKPTVEATKHHMLDTRKYRGISQSLKAKIEITNPVSIVSRYFPLRSSASLRLIVFRSMLKFSSY